MGQAWGGLQLQQHTRALAALSSYSLHAWLKKGWIQPRSAQDFNRQMQGSPSVKRKCQILPTSKGLLARMQRWQLWNQVLWAMSLTCTPGCLLEQATRQASLLAGLALCLQAAKELLLALLTPFADCRCAQQRI